MAKLVVDFTNETAVSVDSNLLQQHLGTILERLNNERELTVEITITDAERIHQLNKQYLQHDYPTDVLSFPAPDEVGESEGSHPLGSIIICLPIAQTQALEAGVRLADELKALAGHSLLHLLGYHHQ